MIPERITTIEAVSMAKSIMEKAEQQRAEFAQRVADSERTGCSCCDPTSEGEEPVVVRLERENATLRALVKECGHLLWLHHECRFSGAPPGSVCNICEKSRIFYRLEAALEGKP